MVCHILPHWTKRWCVTTGATQKLNNLFTQEPKSAVSPNKIHTTDHKRPWKERNLLFGTILCPPLLQNFHIEFTDYLLPHRVQSTLLRHSRKFLQGMCLFISDADHCLSSPVSPLQESHLAALFRFFFLHWPIFPPFLFVYITNKCNVCKCLHFSWSLGLCPGIDWLNDWLIGWLLQLGR